MVSTPDELLRRFLRILLRTGAAALVAALLWLGATPMGRYVARGAWEEGRILLRRKPIPELVADASVPLPVRGRLQLVQEARAYAVDSLGLVAGESFTMYSQLERDTLVLLLTAARRDTLLAKTWWFPVVGRFPYKGFFDFAAAQRAAADLRAAGYDTYMRPASAFSTLGWFNDPLLSTTLRADSATLAATVFHELLHNTLFVKGQVAFNESFASFVGSEAARRFFVSRGDTTNVRRARDDWQNDKLLGTFWAATAHSVDSVLSVPGRDSTTRIAARDSVYQQLRGVLVRDIGPQLRGAVDLRRLEGMQLDNAVLIARRTYASNLYVFDEVHRRLGGSLAATIDQVRRLTSASDDAWDAVRQWLSTPSPSAAARGS